MAAVAAAYYFYGALLPFVKPYLESNTVATIASAAVIFFIALIVASYMTMKIADFVIDSRVGAVDRALGFLFGAARGLLLVVIALYFFDWLVNPPPTWVASAQTKPMLDALGERLVAALPADIEATLQRRRGGSGAGAGQVDQSPPTDAPDAGPRPEPLRPSRASTG